MTTESMSGPKSIALITYPGRPEVVSRLSLVADSLARLGHQVVVLARHPRRARPAASDPAVGDRANLAAGRSPDGARGGDALADLGGDLGGFIDSLSRRLRQRPVDVLHSHGCLAGLAAQLATARATDLTADVGSPALVHTVDHLHSMDRMSPGADRVTVEKLARIERTVAQRADHLVLTHAAHRSVLIRAAGVRPGRMTVVPPALALPPTPASDPSQSPCPERQRRKIILCGRVSPQHAAEIVRTLGRVPDAELVVCDTATEPVGQIEQSLVGLALRGGVCHQVRIVRAGVEETQAELHGAGIVVSGERTGLLHLDAMATGVPVIATTPEVAEAVADGVTGLHVLNTAHGALGHAIRELLASPTTRQAMAAAGVDRALTRYEPAQIASEIDRVYSRLTEALSA